MSVESLVHDDALAHLVKVAEGTPPGAWVEVGVYMGGSAAHLSAAAARQGRAFYAYDTFEGIPYQAEDDSFRTGDLAADFEAVKRLIPGAHVIKGIFPYSAVEMGPIAFVHIDADQHQAHTESLRYLVPRMVVGGIVWCDDCERLPGAIRALNEFLAAPPRPVRAGLAGAPRTGYRYLEILE
jgi:predicted O-methyltransferase YrrM